MGYKYKTQPFKHQLSALLKSANKKNFAYFMEMGCVDEETEFLTQRGWVSFKDFDLHNAKRPLLVAQAIPINPEKHLGDWAFEFVEPIAYIKKPAVDWVVMDMYEQPANESICRKINPAPKIMVTEDHVLPVEYDWLDSPGRQRYSGKKPKYRLLPEATAGFLSAQLEKVEDGKLTNEKYELLPRQAGVIRFPSVCIGGLRGFKSEYFKPDEELMALSEYELRFMIAVLADGTYPNKYDNRVDFYFVKDRKVGRLLDLAAKAGIDMVYEKIKRPDRRNGKPWPPEKEYIHRMHAIAPMRCKEFDERWYTLPQDRLEIIENEIYYWDGYLGKVTGKPGHLRSLGKEYYTMHKECADYAQYVGMACGQRVKVRRDYKTGLWTAESKSSCARTNRTLTPFDPNIGALTRDIYTKNKYRHPQKLKEDHMSYCFRVPSGYLILRRNNRIFISGNSGKTKVMIDNMSVLHQAGHVSGALILAPKGVYRNWSDKEIPTHMPDEIDREILIWDASAARGRKDKLAEQIKNWDKKKFQILVFNIESLISEKGKNLIVDFIKKHNGNIFALVDESTCIKNHKAKRTKAAIEVGQKCKVRRIATGSPVTNSPLDLYAQCAFLDKSLLGYGSYYAFKNTYANIEKMQTRQGQHYERILSYKNLDKLSEKLNKFSYRVTKKECMDLPDKIYITRDVELTPEQIKIYDEMSKYQFALLQKNEEEFHEMSAQVVLTKLLRLHQVLCGSFVNDEGMIIPISNNRIQALKEVLEESSGKVIIWANYIADIEAISKMLETEYGRGSFVQYYGATSADDRVKAIDLFQDKDSGVRFFVGNAQTAGRGITLTAASTVVYYSNSFNLEHRQQSEDRAHRFGQKNKVTYVDLVVRHSLDEKIIKSLINKRNIAQEILQDDNLDDWISLKRD